MMRRLAPLAVLFLLACGPAVTAPARTTVATATSDALAGELAAVGTVSTGLTTFWLTLTENGAPVTDATLTLMPLMTMPTKSHACPLVGDVVAEGKGVYRAQLVFQMASSDMGTWKVDAMVERPGKGKQTLSFPVAVADSGMARVFTVGDTKYVMSFSFDGAPKVGLNPAVVTLHTMKDMMTFPPFDEATLEMVPEMPAMGHGSSNNVAPALTSPGRYEGKVNFSMMGEWKTTFTVKKAGELMTTLSFDTVL